MSKEFAKSYASQFRSLVESRPVFLPGTFYPLGAIQIQNAGFPACYISGAAVSNSLGLLDEGYVSREDVAWIVQKILKVADLPLIVDCDTGLMPNFQIQELWRIRNSTDEKSFIDFCLRRPNPFLDDAFAVPETVKALEKLGVAAIHIEDQDWCWKRCGHLDAKQLVLMEEMVEKIRKACRARKNPDFMVIARTDARAVEGLDGAIRRALAYKEAGADAIFPEALETLDEFREFRRRVPDILLMANLAEQGKTSQSITAQELTGAGYSMILFPATGARMMAYSFAEFLEEIKAQGTTRRFVEEGRLIPRGRLNEIIHEHSKTYRKRNV
jgi:methylisocitrate lyase